MSTATNEEIPPHFILNWDHTGIKIAPSSWTMHRSGSKEVELTGVDDKNDNHWQYFLEVLPTNLALCKGWMIALSSSLVFSTYGTTIGFNILDHCFLIRPVFWCMSDIPSLMET